MVKFAVDVTISILVRKDSINSTIDGSQQHETSNRMTLRFLVDFFFFFFFLNLNIICLIITFYFILHE